MTIKTFLLLTLFTIQSHAQTYNTFYGNLVNNVSSVNILNDLTAFENFGVKELGTPELSNAQAWLVARYQSLGYTDVVEQPFDYSGNTTNNIIVTKTGTVYPNTYVIIDAHYDTINGPGTNDNGSGTVLLLEMARLFANVETEYSIKFIHFSGEENGLIGSNYYVNNTVNPENLDIQLVFNIDEVGGVSGMTNDTIVCEQDESNPSSNNAASSAITQILANCYSLYSNLNTEISFAYASDYVPFENNGEIITGIYEKNETPYAHTSNDLLINMDPAYVYEVAKGALGAALEFAVAYDVLSVDSQETTSAITMYPNPSKGLITIKLNTLSRENTTLTLFNTLGKKVHQQHIIKASTELDLSSLSNGIYIAVIESGTTKTVKKLVLN